MRHPYLAEEDGEGSTSTGTTQGFDQEALAQLVATQVDKSFKEALSNARQSNDDQDRANQQLNQQQDKLPFQDFIDPVVNPRIANAQMQAEIAADKADFYSSDVWLEDVNEFLIEDDPDKRKDEKSKLRTEIERVFSNAVKAGKGVPRADVLSFVIGEKMKKDRIAYQESVNKRSQKRKDTELANAKRQVDMTSGNISSFDASSVHSMPTEKMIEQYGNWEF